MALRNNTNATANFEAEDVEQEVENVKQEVAAAATTTAVATQNIRAVTTASAVVAQNVLSTLKDQFRVEYDSLPRISAEQGSFVFKDDSELEVGGEIRLQLISYQDNWVASPNDTKADIDLVKWSDDGITSRDGINMRDHVADLISQGYNRAKLVHRCIIVGELVAAGKAGEARVGELVQLDLPESGRRSFNTYQLQASYAVAKGRKSLEDAALLSLKAVKEKSKAGESYTKIVVS